MDSYVIRVYRRATANPEAIIGTTETAGITGKQPFAGLEERKRPVLPILK